MKMIAGNTSNKLFPPRFMFMETNKRCNLKCIHCDFWKRDESDKDNYLSRERKREVVEEFAEISPGGHLVICGGEPMLELNEYFSMCKDARDNGLRVLSVVNGTRIRNADMANRMVLEGPHEISISLNSHDPNLHNRTRGVRTAFDKAVTALRLLVEARDRHPHTKTRIVVMGLIFKSNYQDIDGFYDFVLNDIGADNLKLNFIQPTFGIDSSEDAFYRDEGEIDPQVIKREIDACDAKYGLELNPAWKEATAVFFDSLQNTNDRERGWTSKCGTKKPICNSYDRNIMVDHYGVAKLCFSTAFENSKLEKKGDLKQFWYGAENIRRQMRHCTKFCGISHSVRAQSSTLSGQEKQATYENNFAHLAVDVPKSSLVTEIYRRLLKR